MRSVCRRRGVKWDLDLDEGIDLCIYLFGAYEGNILRAYQTLLKPGDVVFDIGANIGSHTLHMAKVVGPSGFVHAFEPTDYAIDKLRLNLALNPDLQSRISAHQLFLTNGEGSILPETVCSSWPVDRWTADVVRAGLDEQHLGRGKELRGAAATTADQFCTANGLQRLDLVKLDVDGNEDAVLSGFRNTLTRFRPKIIIELAPFVHSTGATDSFDSFVNFLACLGYDFFDANTRNAIPSSGHGLRLVIA